MKKLLFLLFCVSCVCATTLAQPGRLDTTVVRGFTVKKETVKYYVSYLHGARDSATIAMTDTLINRAKPFQNNQNVTYPELPGTLIMLFYRITQKTPRGEQRAWNNDLETAIRGVTHPVIQYYIGREDAPYASEVLDRNRLGKQMFKE